MLPIVQRELQVAARSSRLYAWRIRTGLLVILLAAGLIVSNQGGLRAAAAGGVFQVLSFFALLICLLEGTRKAADSISEEKREGTLGLLFLTDLSGFDIILGKLSAALVRSFSVLFAFVPILAISLLLGGTTGSEFWRMVLVLFASLFASLSLCLLVSTISYSGSITASLFALAGWTVIPFILQVARSNSILSWLSALSPFSLFSYSSEAYYSRDAKIFWFGLGANVLIAILSLCLASLILPRIWQDRPRPQTRKNLGVRARNKNLERKGELLEQNPVAWLFLNEPAARGVRSSAWLVAAVSCLSVVAVQWILPQFAATAPSGIEVIVPGIMTLLLVIVTSLWLARESSRNLAEARSNGALELILSTPINIKQVISGQWLALKPTLRLVLVLLAAMTLGAILFSLAYQSYFGIFFVLKSAIQSSLGFFAIGWVGMWMALTSRSPGRAFFKTIMIGLVLPHFLVCIPTILTQIVLLILAYKRVHLNFQRFIANRYFQQTNFILSPVPPGDHATPPVIR